MALFQATRRVLAPLPSGFARTFTSLGPRETKQTVQMTPSLGLGLSKKQSKLDLPEQAIKDVNDHFNLSNGIESRVPEEKITVPMASISTLSSLPNCLKITVSTVADLEKYVQLCKSEGGHSKEEILKVFAHFVNGVDGQQASLNVSTWSFEGQSTSAEVAKKITVGEARQQKQTLPGGAHARTVYAEKLFSSIGGNFGRK